MKTRYSLDATRRPRVPKTLLSLLLVSNFATSAIAESEPRVTAFVGVDVVPMDSERLLENQTVIVRGERIESIGPTRAVGVPPDAEVVEGGGHTLMPGLADMHTHFAGAAHPFGGPDQLQLYLAQGVTTIRALGGLPEHLSWRDQVARGERIGPTVALSGPNLVGIPDFVEPMRYMLIGKFTALGTLAALVGWLGAWWNLRKRGRRISKLRTLLPAVLGGAVLGAAAVVSNLVSFKAELERTNPGVKVVETVEEARAEVRHQRALGYDLIKPYDYSRPEVYEAICREAHVLGMYAAGHLNDELTAQQALEAGLDEFAHVDELMHVHMSGQVSPNSGFEEVSFNYATIPETVAAIKSHDAFVVSNLVADETSYLMLEDVEGQLSKDMYRVVQPEALQSWKTEGRAVAWQGQQDWRRNVLQPFLKALVKALHEAGVPLLLGTDVSVEGMIPWHLHRDLELLVDAGLTPFEALTAGTKNAALSFTRMGKNGDFGTVEVGKLADLILVEGNPLEDVSATQHRVGVMKRGRWYPKTELDALVTAYVARQSEL